MKRAISFVLAVVLAFGMTGVAFAASSNKITDVIMPISSKDFENLEVEPGKSFTLPLTADMFEWSDGFGEAKGPVSSSQISAATVTVKAKYQGKSKDYVKTLEIKSNKAFTESNNKKTSYVYLEFASNLDATAEVDFEFTIYLTVKGSRKSESEVTFSGVLARPIQELYADEDEYVDLSQGALAQSDGYIRQMEFDLGNGLIILGKMYENKKYYGTCEDAVTAADEKVVNAYPEIQSIYRVKTNISGGTVQFVLDEKYHVYDASGKYVGTTDDDLKQSDTYYLATEKIKMTGTGTSSSSSRDDEDDDDGTEPVTEAYETPTPPANVESQTPYNINDNPSTGVGAVRIAISVAVVAAAALIATVKGKKHR